MESTKVIIKSKSTTENILKARLKDSLIILRLMYEDMIKNDVNTKSREMAGRFLYSEGHDQIVKELQSNS